MWRHTQLGETNFARTRELYRLVKSGQITLGGYSKAKIYGTLNCSSGKRMKAENRVFFSCDNEAIEAGYRPCGHCLPEKYRLWKNNQTNKL